jgi:hypothetical protein
MTYQIVDGRIGAQPIATNSTTQNHPLGTIIRAKDDTYGEGEFIYLLGVASTVVGSLVEYNATTYQTALSANTAAKVGPVAVAMSANVATQYGWYQVGGLAVIKKTAVAVAPGVAVYQSGTTGRVMPTSASGKQILGARTANLASVTSTTSTVVVAINRPGKQGQIT